jgi:hypothetical protein
MVSYPRTNFSSWLTTLLVAGSPLFTACPESPTSTAEGSEASATSPSAAAVPEAKDASVEMTRKPDAKLDAGAGSTVELDASVAAEPASAKCPKSACSKPGETRCENGQSSRCISAADGCGTWQRYDDESACSSAAAPLTSSDAGQAGEPALSVRTEILAAAAGVYSTPAPEQPDLRVATDLGWTFVHRDRIWVLFGDSMRVDSIANGTSPDDAIAYMALNDYPDGASAEAFVREHPARAGEPAWRAAAPTLHFLQRPGGRNDFAPQLLERDGMLLSSGTGFTPMGGFSNGRDDERATAFALFFRFEPIQCTDGACADGLVCDTGLGRETREEFNPPCDPQKRDTCEPGPGYCQDQGSSLYDENTEMGRARSIAVRLELGLFDEVEPARFRTQAWDTHRFFNTALRTVSDFDPSRANGEGNDYKPAQGNALERSGVFLWGRPNFGGVRSIGTDAQLYLAWVPMPEVDDTGHIDWRPQFFAGLDDEGRPKFVEREVDSVALDLDAATSGVQPEEVSDIIQQMSVSWVPSLQRFVMFYAGDFGQQFLDGIYRADTPLVNHDPLGSMFVRFAEHPWGPWTAPATLITAGDVDTAAAPTGLYAQGGVLAHNRCTQPDCARYEPFYLLMSGNNNGVLYGANIIDPWTTERANEVDLYWYMSTWNPYQVLLMKTTLSAP